MAYATGSASNLNGLLDAIRLFAIAQGWTIGRWTSASNLLFMSKGQCFVTMEGGTATYNSYPDGVLTLINDVVLRMALGTSLNNSLTTFHSHPGSIVNLSTDNDRIQVSDLVGPFGVYHLFSGDEGAGDPAYIHVVVRTTANRWQHFSFGNLERRGLSHSGVGYLNGASRQFYRNNAAISSVGQYYNHPGSHHYPFSGNFTPAALATISSTSLLHVPDALPVVWSAPPVMSNFSIAATTPGQVSTIQPMERPAEYLSLGIPPSLGGNIVTSPTLGHSGILPLWPTPCIVGNATSLCYVGDFPNVRLCNMEGLSAQQILVFGTDEWMILPSAVQLPWGTDRTAGYDGVSTGQYAVAYRKIV